MEPSPPADSSSEGTSNERSASGTRCWTTTARRTRGLWTLSILLASCLFFSLYDIVVEEIWWSTARIYVPCGAIFALGLLGWKRRSAALLVAFGRILLGVDLFLFAYGAVLFSRSEWLWGAVTMGFGLPVSLLAFDGLNNGMDASQ